MPDDRTPDDQFSDIPPRPPLPTTGPSPSDTGAPLSRRQMRELAARQGTGPQERVPDQAADEHPPGQSAQEHPRVQSAQEPARVGASPSVMTLDDLFTEEKHIVPDRAEKRRNRRIGGWIALFVVLLLVGGVVGGGWWAWSNYEDRIREFMGWEEPKDFEAGEATGEALVTIASGDVPTVISRSLYDAGVTKTPEAFYDHLIEEAINPTFYPGVYRLQQRMTSAAALAALENPESKLENSALVREGLTLDRTLTVLSEGLGIPVEDFIAATADPAAYGVAASSLEGWLFPAMYTFDPGVTATQVIQTLVNRTVQSLDQAGVPVEDRQRVLTIASIIEREARINEDFYKVSRVIQNRLDIGMKLQMDSTAQFGYGEMHDGTVSSSAAALEDVNDWNTYVIEGLPIGPIANPGDVAIDAAMHPADGPWLFFVTWNMDTGETIFTTTDAEHEEAKKQWAQWCRDNDNRGC